MSDTCSLIRDILRSLSQSINRVCESGFFSLRVVDGQYGLMLLGSRRMKPSYSSSNVEAMLHVRVSCPPRTPYSIWSSHCSCRFWWSLADWIEGWTRSLGLEMKVRMLMCFLKYAHPTSRNKDKYPCTRCACCVWSYKFGVWNRGV